MNDPSLAFFKALLEKPSPSGFEEPVQRVVRDWAGQFADEVRTDVHGNVIATLNPMGSPRILLDGHCDQIGLMVNHIDDNGYLYVQAIGGWDMQVLLGQSVTVWTASGPQPGVIARKATHLLTDDERKAVPKIHELWVDLAVANKAEAEQLVSIGDPITPVLGLRPIRGDVHAATKMDNTTGLFVVFDALRRLAGRKIAPALFVVSAVQEEIGLRGTVTSAYGIAPDVGVAVDVTHATDIPGNDPRQHGIVKLGQGPVLFRGPNINPVVLSRLQSLAKEHQIPVQNRSAARGLSNDSNALQLIRAGVATGCIGIPNRYMHSPVEMISLADLDNASALLAEFVASITSDTDFTPR